MKNNEEALKAAEKAHEHTDDQIKARYKAKLEQIKKAMEKEKEKK